ncbi:hypothetical protein WJX77_007277 [Trebouxia sp. C0004]
MNGMPASLTVLCPLLLAVAWAFYAYAPEPYMDEPFHVPQTQRYCSGLFYLWDPKITTFPGLYIFGTAHARALQLLGSVCLPDQYLPLVQGCNTALLRSSNLVLGVLCFVLLRNVYQLLHPMVTSAFCTEMAWLVVLFPLHFFFHFLYYTDVGSLTFVMASYLACLKHRYQVSALLAGWAVLFRQTNAVWVCFIIGMSVLKRCLKAKSDKPISEALPQQLMFSVERVWHLKWVLLADLWGLILVPLIFAAFVVWNGSIVLGDKAAHTPVKHLMQPLYFVLFTAIALGPFHFSPARLHQALIGLQQALRWQPLQTSAKLLSVTAILGLLVNKFTMVHPYLVADNRHYTFYIWKDILTRSPAARYALIPLYAYSGRSVWNSVKAQQLRSCALLMTLCTAVTLVPAWLIEFRYFTIPFAMVALHMQPASASQLKLIIAAYALTNAATVYIFLFRPFQWPDHSIARFIW